MLLKDKLVQMHLHSNGNGADLHAIGAIDSLKLESPAGAWRSARNFLDNHPEKYVFAAFSYELKDDVEKLSSGNSEHIAFPALYLFVPEVVLAWEMGELEVLQINNQDLNLESVKESIITLYNSDLDLTTSAEFDSISKENYLEKVSSLKEHIQRGDIYEVNYCQEFKAQQIDIDPWSAFQRLNERTKAPFACHLRIDDVHLLCASPELFLEKQGSEVISKPIKGTRRRDPDPAQDEALKKELKNDMKERAENVMITDLVRNDLSRTAAQQSVEVKELCEVYSFETVHQMISTVRSELSKDHDIIDLISTCFPMGSMTGAPKIRAMELIEEHEEFKRGIYSGAVGVITPSQNMALNVVIRSIVYDAQEKKASVAAGGAITALSDPEKEYEESLLKARAMMGVLGIDL